MTSPAAPNRVGQAVRLLRLAVTRHWGRLLLPIIVGTALTLWAAFSLSQQSWESSGVMIYSPLPIPDQQKGLFPQPDLPTLVTLVRSPSVLAGLREEFDLTMPTSVLEKSFKVTSQRNTQTVTVTLQWAEPDTAAKMTNRLMERFIDEIRTYRRQKATTNQADFESRLSTCDAQHEVAARAYRDHFRKHNLFDAKNDLETLRREIDSLLYSRSLAVRSEPVTRAKRDRIAKDLSDLRKQDDEQAQQDKKLDAAQESVVDARRRQDRLRELIIDEKDRQNLMVELSAKRKEYEKRQGLLRNGAEAQSVVDALAAEIDVITNRLTDSEQVKKWKDELQKIDKVVVPNAKGARQGSPIIAQTLQKQLELDLEMIGPEKQIFEIDRELSASRNRQEQLRTLLGEADNLQNEMNARMAERQQLSDQVVLFRRLRDQEAGEFSIISPASPGPFPVKSTRKLILGSGLALTLLLGLARICWRAWRDHYHGGRALASRLAVPALAELDDTEESVRVLATELRRWKPDYGTTVVWVEDADPIRTGASALDRVSRRLALRDERVLVIDCRLGMVAPTNGVAGLADVLAFRALGWDHLLVEGLAPGVDVLPAGGSADRDLVATQLMREIVAEAAKRYSMVLLHSPPPDDPNTIESLMAWADGMVLCLDRRSASRSRTAGLAALSQRFATQMRCVPTDLKAAEAIEPTG